MRQAEPKTPLMALLRQLDDVQRAALADKARTTVSYLHHIAGCAREPRVRLAHRIAQASEWVNKRWGTAVITLEQLATMCDEV